MGQLLTLILENANAENALGIFTWKESQSGAGGIRYHLRSWKDKNRGELVFESEPLNSNFASIRSFSLSRRYFECSNLVGCDCGRWRRERQG